MKHYLVIFFMIAISSKMMASTYYVAPDGDDQNEGTTIDQPLGTISRAVTLVQPGDTILVRGGEYLLNGRIKISNSGEPGKIIRLWAYPGEHPYLNFSAMPEGSTDRGIQLTGRYWYIRGFEIANAKDNGLIIDSGHFNIIENCTFHNNGDTGLQISGGSAYNEVINCDSYFNRDVTMENADGFAAKLDIGKGNRFIGCRSWNNADDGWDLYEGQEPVEIHYCWAFRNGYLEDGSPAIPNGDMNGFKLGGNYVAADHLITHSIAFHNGAKGFDQNHNNGDVTLLNNTSWMNGTYYSKPNYNFPVGQNIFRNNVSFLSTSNDQLSSGVSEHNSWEGYTVDSTDFLSLDTALAVIARNEDGSLPETDLLRPASGSDLVDAGVETGFPYSGLAPDIGARESEEAPGAGDWITLVTVRSAYGITEPSSGIFPKGFTLTVEAIPYEGYLFSSWKGSIESVENPLILTADTNIFLEPVFMVDTSSANGVDDKMTGPSLQIYPNPASDHVRLVFSGDLEGEGLIRVIDLLGKRLMEKQVEVNELEEGTDLDISQLKPGIYIVSFYSSQRSWHCRLIVDRDGY